MTKVLDEGDPLDIIYLDFAKAFDKVPHKRLIRDLQSVSHATIPLTYRIYSNTNDTGLTLVPILT